MKRTVNAMILILVLLLGLTGCGDDEPIVNSNGPGRMVKRIEVTVEPREERYERTYVTQENMNELLAMLRGMADGEEPETEPDVDGGQVCYTATVTFANGEQSVYYLLGHTYMRLGSDPWCIIEREQSMGFTEFLRDHPSDDGSVPLDTTSPAETTAPSSGE